MPYHHRSHRPLAAVLVLAAVAVVACLTAAPARAALTPGQIDTFLLEQGSPLAGEGEAFYLAGERNGVDPAFLVAIAGAESSFGRFLFSSGTQTATYNAFNWFYAPTRAGSGFAGWGQAIGTVAAGLRGPLYYGAGRYSVAAIAPVYCPQGTQDWVTNVTAYMLELGADPGDTRWPATTPVAGGTGGVGVALTGAGGATLIVEGPVVVVPRHVVARAPLRIRFTLVNGGIAAGRWRVIVRLEGPRGQELALGTRAAVRLGPGCSYAFVARLRLPAAGRWRVWIDAQTQAGMIVSRARPALGIAVARAASGRAARRDHG